MSSGAFFHRAGGFLRQCADVVFGARAQAPGKREEDKELTRLFVRVLFDTHGSYARLGATAQEGQQTKQIEQDLGRIGRRITHLGAIEKSLHGFYEAHPEFREALDPILQTLDISHEIALFTDIAYKARAAGHGSDSYLERCSAKIVEKCNSLRSGASLLVPLSVKRSPESPSGHSVSLELRKTENGEFTCLLHNTGEGLRSGHQRENTAFFISGKPRGIWHPITWTHILPTRLNSEFFQNVLLRPIGGTKELVDYLHAALGADDKEAALHERGYQSQGKMGSCTYKSISVWLHGAMDAVDPSGRLYRQFKYESTEKLLERFDFQLPYVRGLLTATDSRPVGSLLTMNQLQRLRDGAEQVLERRAARVGVKKPSRVRQARERQSTILKVFAGIGAAASAARKIKLRR